MPTADVSSGRRFCSEALAIARAICSWFALSCSASPGAFAGQFCLAGLELLDLLLHACEIARHRLEQLCLLGSDRGGCRVLRRGLRRRWQLRNCCIRRSQLNRRRALLVGKLRCFRRQRRSRSQLRRPPGDHRPDRLAIGLPGESCGTDARRQQQADQAAQRRPAPRWLTKPFVRAASFSSLEICSLNRASSSSARAICSISMREPFIGARDQLDLLRGQCRIESCGSACLVFTGESMGASCQFAVN